MINKILQENIFNLKVINETKLKFWIVCELEALQKPILNLFKKITGSTQQMFITPIDLKNLFQPHQLNNLFLDFFFYLNGNSNHYLSFIEFQNYLMNFLGKGEN